MPHASDFEDDDLENEDDEEFDRLEVPAAAGRYIDQVGYEPDNDWLRSASSPMRKAAMREWFLSRFQDPANETPYESAEGGYQWVYGGPYDANDELSSRFGDLCSDREIDAVVANVEADGIHEWAGNRIDERDDEAFDKRFALHVDTSAVPIQRLKDTLSNAVNVLRLSGDTEALAFARQLAYSSLIGALEAYLYETAYYWANTDETVLKALVTKLPIYQQEKIPLAAIFDRHEKIRGHVLGYLQNITWHRWEKEVKQVFKVGLGIELPGTAELQKALDIRHDIVHRSGRDMNGNPVSVTDAEVMQLRNDVLRFASKVAERISDHDGDLTVDGEDADGQRRTARRSEGAD